MSHRNIFSPLIGGLLFTSILIHPSAKAAEPINESSRQSTSDTNDRSENSKILVEIFLSPERKGEIDAIKKEFEALSITKVRPQLFRQGHPPQNIGFGKMIPADVARQAIRLALTYNDGIQFLLPEKRLASHYIGIGVSIFDEAFLVPVSPEELKRLSDPTLTDDPFHELYRTMTDKPPRINR